jgi:hypothetical protein
MIILNKTSTKFQMNKEILFVKLRNCLIGIILIGVVYLAYLESLNEIALYCAMFILFFVIIYIFYCTLKLNNKLKTELNKQVNLDLQKKEGKTLFNELASVFLCVIIVNFFPFSLQQRYYVSLGIITLSEVIMIIYAIYFIKKTNS